MRNYLVEGVSGTGKTSVCRELRQRGHHVVDGDRELAYQGDPKTGEALDTADHEHHIWDVGRVHALVADQRPPGEWGSKPAERDLVVRLHRTKEDIPSAGTAIDATRPLAVVVDDILRRPGLADAPDR